MVAFYIVRKSEVTHDFSGDAFDAVQDVLSVARVDRTPVAEFFIGKSRRGKAGKFYSLPVVGSAIHGDRAQDIAREHGFRIPDESLGRGVNPDKPVSTANSIRLWVEKNIFKASGQDHGNAFGVVIVDD